MEIKYQIFEREHILVQKFTGFFSIEFYMKYAQFIMRSPESRGILKILIDFRELKFGDFRTSHLIELDQIIEIRKNLNPNDNKSVDIKHVIWVDKPLPTAIIQLFVENFPHLDYKYCSTIPHVLSTLNPPEYFRDLENIVKNLSETLSNQSETNSET